MSQSIFKLPQINNIACVFTNSTLTYFPFKAFNPQRISRSLKMVTNIFQINFKFYINHNPI